MAKQILILICAIALAARVQLGAIDLNHANSEHEQEADKKQKYTCLMHPEVVADQPGNCPKCGMKLVPLPERKRPTPNPPTLTRRR